MPNVLHGGRSARRSLVSSGARCQPTIDMKRTMPSPVSSEKPGRSVISQQHEQKTVEEYRAPREVKSWPASIRGQQGSETKQRKHLIHTSRWTQLPPGVKSRKGPHLIPSKRKFAACSLALTAPAKAKPAYGVACHPDGTRLRPGHAIDHVYRQGQ